MSREKRSEIMALVRGKDTRPEMAVRKLVWSLGYRYRLHRKELAGCPDLVFFGRRKIIFVHGCFWHRHKGCALARMPKSRIDFWAPKLEGNAARDKNNKRALIRQGWKVMTVWECELKDLDRVTTVARRFLNA
ncbi:MAG: DNA mismatch endonuclease Vsr [Nitrospira sp.]|nr:DNA mismatch endonuclease Vsr [Nitrospira sp.]